MVSASAQVEPPDSTQNIFLADSSMAISDTALVDTSVSDRFRLSTDSVYSTPTKPGLLSDLIDYTAEDSIIGSIAEGVIHLYNKAYTAYQNITLKAGYIRINFNTNELYAEGLADSTGKTQQKPIFTEDGKAYRADVMRYNFDTKRAHIQKVITQEGDGFLHGERVKKTGDNVFFVKNAAFTTCSHEHPHFNIKTPKAKVISGEKVVTQFAYLELIDVPTPLMVPFGFFPTTDRRKSGIIIPAYGQSEFRGYFLTNGGYYWAVNDYMDLTFTGDVYTQGGFGLRTNANYRTRYKYNGTVNIGYNLIRFGEEEFVEFVPSAFDNRSDFSIQWSHQQDGKARPDFRFGAQVNIASAQYNKVVDVNTNNVLQNRLNSSVNITKTFYDFPFTLNLSLTHQQNNQTNDISFSLPKLNFNLNNRYFPFKRKLSAGPKKWYEEIGLSYSMNAVNEIRTKLDQPIFTPEVFRDSSRSGMQHNMQITANYKILKNFVLTPAVSYTERWYLNRRNYFFDEERSPTSALYDTVNGFFANRDFNTRADMTTKVYGLFRYRGFVRAIRHVMTPSVGFSYKPDFSEEFWGYYQRVQNDTDGTIGTFNRYQGAVYGSASQGVQGNVNFSLLNTLEAKVRSKRDSSGLKKIKLLERFSLRTSYNMAAEEFNWSNLRFDATSSAFNGIVNLNYNATFDFYGFDEELEQRVNRSALDVNGVWFRNTQQQFAVGLNLNSDSFGKKKKKNKKPVPRDQRTETVNDDSNTDDQENNNDQGELEITEGDVNYYDLRNRVEFDSPWNLGVSYNLSESKPRLESVVNQSVTINGDISLTENWRVGFNTGYDLEANDFTFTTFDFRRDLHCWEITCSWVPFGFQQSYFLTIRVKADMLSDLKFERRRTVGDFER